MTVLTRPRYDKFGVGKKQHWVEYTMSRLCGGKTKENSTQLF